MDTFSCCVAFGPLGIYLLLLGVIVSVTVPVVSMIGNQAAGLASKLPAGTYLIRARFERVPGAYFRSPDVGFRQPY